MEKRLGEALQDNQQEIAHLWAQRVRQSSEHYRQRPLQEIEAVSAQLVAGLVEALTLGDYAGMRSCLQAVAEMRSSQGFEAAEVQRALLMGCDSIFPTLERAFGEDARLLVWSVTQVERAVHRSISLLNEAFRQAEVRTMASQVQAEREARGNAEARLQAVLAALGYGAVAVDPNLIVTWADDRARSPRCGATEPGELYHCTPSEYGGECLLAAAIETGQVQRGEPGGECTLWLAIPVRDENGVVVGAVGLMGSPSAPG